MLFHQRKPFDIEPDGTIVVRAGSQSGCGGIALIWVRITPSEKAGIAFLPLEDAYGDEKYDGILPAAEMPADFRAAVFRGAQQEYETAEIVDGVLFELIKALVHPVDARESQFLHAGRIAMKGWMKQRGLDQWELD